MTIFEKIIAREIPATIEFESEDVLAFRDLSPEAPTHILIIPKKPIPNAHSVGEADAHLLGKMVLAAQDLAKKFGVDGSGYRLVMNCGPDAGQSVNHFHMHLLGGRKLKWPPG